jgi:hypothetical protein
MAENSICNFKRAVNALCTVKQLSAFFFDSRGKCFGVGLARIAFFNEEQ